MVGLKYKKYKIATKSWKPRKSEIVLDWVVEYTPRWLRGEGYIQPGPTKYVKWLDARVIHGINDQKLSPAVREEFPEGIFRKRRRNCKSGCWYVRNDMIDAVIDRLKCRRIYNDFANHKIYGKLIAVRKLAKMFKLDKERVKRLIFKKLDCLKHSIATDIFYQGACWRKYVTAINEKDLARATPFLQAMAGEKIKGYMTDKEISDYLDMHPKDVVLNIKKYLLEYDDVTFMRTRVYLLPLSEVMNMMTYVKLESHATPKKRRSKKEYGTLNARQERTA